MSNKYSNQAIDTFGFPNKSYQRFHTKNEELYLMYKMYIKIWNKYVFKK